MTDNEVTSAPDRHPGFPAPSELHAGRTYLVTGAARGIGRASAEVLLAHGATVVIADVDEDAITATARDIGATPFVLDVTSRESWERARDALTGEFGPRLAGLVNNAGITRDKTLSKMDDSMWDSVLDTHLRGTWLGCQVMRPLLAAPSAEDEAGRSTVVTDAYGRPAGGAIVNTSSSGRHGSYGQTNYSAAKAGIVGLTKTIALEFARFGIRANCVSPGPVATDMTAGVPDEVKATWLGNVMLSRMGLPHEIGTATAFLLSSAASYITAQVLDVNGGEWHP
ncbi:SDR family NAD(P)-dependent oxidoreductase [Saccharomonospora sp. NPDC006951]